MVQSVKCFSHKYGAHSMTINWWMSKQNVEYYFIHKNECYFTCYYFVCCRAAAPKPAAAWLLRPRPGDLLHPPPLPLPLPQPPPHSELNVCDQVSISLFYQQTQEPDAGVKTCWFREAEKAANWLSSPAIPPERELFLLLLKQKLLQPDLPPLYFLCASLSNLTLYGYFQSVGCLLYHFPYGMLFLFCHVYNRQKVLGLKVYTRTEPHPS